MKKKLLTKKRKAWASSRGGATFKGLPLNYNASSQAKYVAALEKLAREMTKITRREVEGLFKAHGSVMDGVAMDASLASQARILCNALMGRFQKLFNDKAWPLAERMVGQQDAASKSSLAQSLKAMSGGLTIKTDIFNRQLGDITKAAVAENVALIKSISTDYINQVQGSVMRSITSGQGLKDLIPALENYEGVTHRRAKNIALDQTRKVYSAINRERMKAAGVKKFEWLHTGGSQKPRQLHIEMNGNIYEIDNPPIIDERSGERGLPGQAVNCRCRMLPVFEFEGEE